MNDTETAWVAGLLEGEGCFHLKKKYGSYINCSMTDEDVIRRLHALVGCGTVTPVQPRKEGYKRVWTWRTGAREDVERLCVLLLPWMGERRSEKIHSILGEFKRSPRERVVKGGLVHGIRGGYTKGCRCAPCTEAESRYQRDLRDRRKRGEVGQRGIARKNLQDRIEEGRRAPGSN